MQRRYNRQARPQFAQRPALAHSPSPSYGHDPRWTHNSSYPSMAHSTAMNSPPWHWSEVNAMPVAPSLAGRSRGLDVSARFHKHFRPVSPGSVILVRGVRDFQAALKHAEGVIRAMKDHFNTEFVALSNYPQTIRSVVWRETLLKRAKLGAKAVEMVGLGSSNQKGALVLQNISVSLRERLEDVKCVHGCVDDDIIEGAQSVLPGLFNKVQSSGRSLCSSILSGRDDLHHLDQALSEINGLQEYLKSTKQFWEDQGELREKARQYEDTERQKEVEEATRKAAEANQNGGSEMPANTTETGQEANW